MLSYITVGEYRRRYPSTELKPKAMFAEIESASLLVEDYCNTRFTPVEDAYSLDFGRRFYAIKAPLISVLSLEADNTMLVENKDYYVYPESRTVEIDEEYETPRKIKKALTIRYLYGYASVPQTVKEVIMDLINLNTMVADGKLSDAAHQSESWEGDYSYTKATGAEYTTESLRKGILSRLEPYVAKKIVDLPVLVMDDGNVRALIV